MSITGHWLLALLWIFYGILHSLFAAPWWKLRMQRMLGESYRFYRPAYSVFAFLSLAFILIYQYSISTRDILQFPLWTKIALLPLGIVGLVFMWKSIRKYFFYLSGIDVVINQPATAKLETTGLHRMVRHPLYFGTLAVIWTLFTWFPTFVHAIACLIISLYTLVGIRLEEDKLIGEFGESYRAYRQQVSMLIPGMPVRKRITL